MALFDAAIGGEKPEATPGAEGYQNFLVQGAQRNLRPAYQQALGNLRQNFAGRGLLDSGLNAQAEMGLQQGFLNDLGKANQEGARVGEENRRREQQRGWQVEDRNANLEWMREQQRRAEEAADAARWANLIGGVASTAGGIVGGIYGGPMGAVAGQQGGQALGQAFQPNKAKASANKNTNPYGVSGVDQGIDWSSLNLDPQLAQYANAQ